MTIYPGEFVGVMGPSGSGKTTLLNVISTIDTPTSGRVRVGGQELSNLKRRDLARFRRERLGFIFQEFNLLDTLTLRENIGLALSIAGKEQNIDRNVTQIAQRLGRSSTTRTSFWQMSPPAPSTPALPRCCLKRSTT